MLVLRILPLRADTLLEEMVVGLEGETGDRSNVVLRQDMVNRWPRPRVWLCAHIYAPELLHGLEGDDFLQQVVPVVAL